MRLLKQLLVVLAVAFAGGQAVAAVRDNAWLTLVAGLVTAAAAIGVYAWVVRRTERRSPTEVARAGAVSRTAVGMLIGAGMFGAVILNIGLMGGYQVHGVGSVTGAVGFVGFMAAAAVTEELLFRGVLFRVVEERLGTWISLLLSGVLFGAVVSGNGESEGLLDASTSGPVILSGGDFGPEGSLYTVGAGVALTVVFLWLARRRGNIVPRRRAEATATVAR